MIEKLNCGSCLSHAEKPMECKAPCIHDVLQCVKTMVVDATEKVLTVLDGKFPDPPLQLVHSREVCQYVGIVPKTLYRSEKQGAITYVKKDHTGKYYSHADMVAFKRMYHGLD